MRFYIRNFKYNKTSYITGILTEQQWFDLMVFTIWWEIESTPFIKMEIQCVQSAAQNKNCWVLISEEKLLEGSGF